MAPRIDWTLLSKEWEKFWIAFRDEENKATVLNAFWNTRGGRGRYFHTGPSGLEFPRGRYPVGDDGTENIYTVTPLDKLKGQPSSEPVKPESRREAVLTKNPRLMMESHLKRLKASARTTPVEPEHERFERNMLKTTKDRQIISCALIRPRVPVYEEGAFGENVKFLHAEQSLVGSDLQLWYLDDIESPLKTIYIRSFHEGDIVPEGHDYITSVRLRNGETWHVFKTMEKD